MQNSSNISSTDTHKDTHKVTTYPNVKLQQNEVLRRNIIEASASIMQRFGPEAVTIRRVAEKMECPTKIIYKLFGSKEGLAKELFMEGCKLLSDTFQDVPVQTNLKQYLLDIGQAYWNFSKEYTNYYMVMFGGAFSEFKPEEDSSEAIVTALKQVAALISNAIEQGLILEKDPLLVVNLVWSSLHGVIHLYLGGHIHNESTAKILYDRTLLNLVHTFFQGQ